MFSYIILFLKTFLQIFSSTRIDIILIWFTDLDPTYVLKPYFILCIHFFCFSPRHQKLLIFLSSEFGESESVWWEKDVSSNNNNVLFAVVVDFGLYLIVNLCIAYNIIWLILYSQELLRGSSSVLVLCRREG